ncbi:hypothetical protein VTG60DRAFT_2065 [Thermothelomyces hinnuleus]
MIYENWINFSRGSDTAKDLRGQGPREQYTPISIRASQLKAIQMAKTAQRCQTTPAGPGILHPGPVM